MRKIIISLSLLSILSFTTGCLNAIQGQKITVQKRNGEEEFFEDFKEVNQKRQVKQAINIVENANWESKVMEMERYADYQFQFPFKNSNENKIASYSLWVSKNGESLEIVTAGDRYVTLTKQDSASLYKILTKSNYK